MAFDHTKVLQNIQEIVAYLVETSQQNEDIKALLHLLLSSEIEFLQSLDNTLTPFTDNQLYFEYLRCSVILYFFCNACKFYDTIA